MWSRTMHQVCLVGNYRSGRGGPLQLFNDMLRL